MELFDNFEVIDILAHEYGWDIDYIQELDTNEIHGLVNAINERKLEHYKMLSYISVLAFNGKTIDSILNPKPKLQKSITEEEKQQLENQREKQQEQMMIKLFSSLGMKPKRLKEGLDKGKLEI